MSLLHALQGKTPWNKGLKMSEDTRAKMSAAHLNTTHLRSTRKKMSRSHTGKRHTPVRLATSWHQCSEEGLLLHCCDWRLPSVQCFGARHAVQRLSSPVSAAGSPGGDVSAALRSAKGGGPQAGARSGAAAAARCHPRPACH